MGALTRVLSEEYKKSVELCYNILRAFLVRGHQGNTQHAILRPVFVQELHYVLGEVFSLCKPRWL